jgi:arsenite-transporting ATPase
MLRFLDNPPPCLFFTGKGGVGKTSVACATAVGLADQGKRVLLVSTDPASNVGQVLETSIGAQITAIPGVPRLMGLEIDPQAAARRYRERVLAPVRALLPAPILQAIEEQLSGACTTEIAAFDEFTGLLSDTALRLQFDHIVFDTAPTGHTVRLLQLPSAWSSFLQDGRGDASCLGPLAGLARQREQYEAALAALADPHHTRLVLVARPQEAALQEVARAHAALSACGVQAGHLVLNACFPAHATEADPLADALVAREREALSGMPDAMRALVIDRIGLRGHNAVGLVHLRQFMHPAPAVASRVGPTDPPDFPALPSFGDLVDELARQDHGLILVTGKGGVGKTTVAAALALALSARGHAVHLSTSDPAAQLDLALQQIPEQISISRIDPLAETARYRAHVLDTKSQNLDEAGRAALIADLQSPCTEEIAVFQAFSRIIQEAGDKFVIMDTAPTGHTLLLLDATRAYHRETERQMGAKRMGYATPLMQLRDPDMTKVLILAAPETTPVLEAASLQQDLRRAGIEPWAWVLNQSVVLARPHCELLRQRCAQELPQLQAVRERHASRIAAIPLLAQEPVGFERLRALSKTSTQ